MVCSISPTVRRAAAYPGGVRYIRNVSRKTAKSSHARGSIVGGTAGEDGGGVAPWEPFSGPEGSGGGGAAGGGPGGSGGSAGGSEDGAAYSDGGRGLRGVVHCGISSRMEAYSLLGLGPVDVPPH